jgi:hypothetical protein
VPAYSWYALRYLYVGYALFGLGETPSSIAAWALGIAGSSESG